MSRSSAPSAAGRGIVSAGPWLAILVVLAAAAALEARPWKAARGSPPLDEEGARIAVAARELAERGRLAAPFALPIELVRHPQPPWPLVAVDPGLVMVEAAVERMATALGTGAGAARLEQRAGLARLLPAASYAAIALLWMLGAAWLVARHRGAASARGLAAGMVVALAFLLDPEAQRLAARGVPDLPLAALFAALLAMVASGGAARRPAVFGLLLGIAVAFRADAILALPGFAAGAVWLAPAGARRRAAVAIALGALLPLAPWWVYRTFASGVPGGFQGLALWDGVEGRSWFAMMHLAETPRLPRGAAALGLLAAKAGGHLGPLALALATGPGALWIGALGAWLGTRPPRPWAVAGGLILLQTLLALVAAAATLPGLRPLFPIRVALEAAGLLATWALLGRAPEPPLGPGTRRALAAGVAALALGWGAWRCAREWTAVQAAGPEGLPRVETIADLAHRLDGELARGEPVMSNLGPTLAWYGRRPVVHLALSPEDLEGCRARLTFTHLVLVFRDASRAWSEWRAVMEPGGEGGHPEWNVTRARRWRSADGFEIVWLELGAPRPQLAAIPPFERRGD